MKDAFPGQNAGASDDAAFRNHPGGGLGPDPMMNMIGGTHHVSTKISPQEALTGGYQPIEGDTMPAGAPVDGSAPYTGPYLPKN